MRRIRCRRQDWSAQAPGEPSGSRRRPGRRRTVAAILALSAALLAVPLAGPVLAQVPATTELRLIPRDEALVARWSVTSTERLIGFRLRYRPVSALPLPWSRALELSAETTRYKIRGLSVQPYEVRVRPVLDGGQFGAGEVATGIPLASGVPEEGPEPPLEEPPEEPPAPGPLYRGVNSHASWHWQVSEAAVKREIAEAAALGANVMRIPVEWGDIEHDGEGSRGGAMLERLDLIVNEAAAHAIKIDGTIASTPDWAAPGGAWHDAPSEPEKGLRGFAKFIAARYGSKLVALNVWNEPVQEDNISAPSGELLSNTTEGGIAKRAFYYVKMVKAVYLGAHEGNSAIKVLAHEDGIDGPGSNRRVFLLDCLADGMKGYFDAIGQHAYSDGGAPEAPNLNSIQSKLERMHAFLVEHGVTVPIWNNEWGYSTENSETVRAQYVEKAVRMMDTQFPYLEGWNYYQLRDTALGTGFEENFGLLQYGFLPRLSFAAFAAGMLEE
jgi:hypothetical protein